MLGRDRQSLGRFTVVLRQLYPQNAVLETGRRGIDVHAVRDSDGPEVLSIPPLSHEITAVLVGLIARILCGNAQHAVVDRNIDFPGAEPRQRRLDCVVVRVLDHVHAEFQREVGRTPDGCVVAPKVDWPTTVRGKGFQRVNVVICFFPCIV